VRAAKEAEMVLAEEAAMMAEALADVALATTIATADADNNRHGSTIAVGDGNGGGSVMEGKTAA